MDYLVTSIVHQFSCAIGKSKGSKTRRQSYPQRRSSKVEDIAEDSENEEEVGLPQKSDGKYTFLELRCYWVVNNRFGWIQGGGGGRGSGPPLKNHKNIGFLSNSGPDPLKNHEATEPVFNVGPLSARQ